MLRRFGLGVLIALVVGLAAGAAPRVLARRAPVSPQAVGFAPSPGLLRDIELTGDYAYALSDYGNQIDVFSIADPAAPQLTAVYTVTPTRSSFTDIALTADYLYLSTTQMGLRVLSLADPARPAEVGSFPPGLYEQFYSVTLGPGYLLVAGDSGLRVLSLADPANPTQIGMIDWAGPDPEQAWAPSRVVLDGRYAYVSAFNPRTLVDWRLFVVDLRDPAHPAHVPQSEWRMDTDWLLEASAGYGYLGGHTATLSIIDLRDPAALTTTATLDQQAGEWKSSGAGALFGSYLYLGTFDGVKVIDAADPSAPQVVGAALDGAQVRAVEQRGAYLYVADQNGLTILTSGLDLGHRLYLPGLPAD